MSLKHHVILITVRAAVWAVQLPWHCQKTRSCYLLDKNIAKLEAVYDAILTANAPEPIIYPFDLAGPMKTSIRSWRIKLMKNTGFAGLLHSAVEFSSFTRSANSVRRNGAYLNVNLNAPFLLTRCYCRYCKKSTCSIVFTSDASAEKLMPIQALMACPK